jgi:hypothetical protein
VTAFRNFDGTDQTEVAKRETECKVDTCVKKDRKANVTYKVTGNEPTCPLIQGFYYPVDSTIFRILDMRSVSPCKGGDIFDQRLLEKGRLRLPALRNSAISTSPFWDIYFLPTQTVGNHQGGSDVGLNCPAVFRCIAGPVWRVIVNIGSVLVCCRTERYSTCWIRSNSGISRCTGRNEFMLPLPYITIPCTSQENLFRFSWWRGHTHH